MTNLSVLQAQLATAIEQDDHPTIEYLLVVKNVNPNFATESGFPIHIAAFWVCDIQTFRLLLDAGADPNPPSKSMTPLQRCISQKDLRTVELLVKRGADVNFKGGISRTTPLHTSIMYKSNAITKFLLDSNASVNARDDVGNTPIHTLISSSAAPIDLCKMLIDAGADLSLADYHGYTPLHLAVCENNMHAAVALLENGANPLAVTKQRESALHLVCQSHAAKLEMLELLIRVGVPIESHNDKGFTPLHSAVYRHRVEAIFYLVKAGANVNTVNNMCRIPIYIAAPRQDMSCLNILLTGGSRVTKELCEVKCTRSPVLVSDHSNPLGAYMKYLSSHTQSLREICILIIRQMLAPHLQTKAYLLPVPYAFQKEIALESLVLDDLSDISKFKCER